MSKSEIQQSTEIEEDTQKNKFLTFSIGNESYGIDIRYVIEIIGILPITEVPELPDYIRGIVNLRGKIIPVMDVRLRFNKNLIDYNDRTCIIVIETKDILMGLIIDSVSEVLSIPEEEIVPPPKISKISNKYVRGIGKVEEDVKLLLDCDRLISEEEAEKLIDAI